MNVSFCYRTAARGLPNGHGFGVGRVFSSNPPPPVKLALFRGPPGGYPRSKPPQWVKTPKMTKITPKNVKNRRFSDNAL